MEVKRHTYVEQLRQADPANYAVSAGLVGQHAEWVFAEVGAWRWPIMHEQRERIVELLTAGYSIDLGGAAAPVGYGAVIVDYQGPFGLPRSLADVPPNADCIFSSHTLEHFTDQFNVLAAMTAKLKLGGHLIIQVPSWQRVDLRASNWPYHEHTFCLGFETNAPAEFIRLDDRLEDWGYEIEYRSTNTTTQHILVIARRARKVLI